MQLAHHFSPVQNMGWADRTVRFAVGIAMVVVVLMEIESGGSLGMVAYLPILAIYPLMTAILGWDPLYSAGHVRSCDSTGRNQCGTFPYEVEAALGKKLECDNGYDCSLAGDRHAHQQHK